MVAKIVVGVTSGHEVYASLLFSEALEPNLLFCDSF